MSRGGPGRFPDTCTVLSPFSAQSPSSAKVGECGTAPSTYICVISPQVRLHLIGLFLLARIHMFQSAGAYRSRFILICCPRGENEVPRTGLDG